MGRVAGVGEAVGQAKFVVDAARGEDRAADEGVPAVKRLLGRVDPGLDGPDVGIEAPREPAVNLVLDDDDVVVAVGAGEVQRAGDVGLGRINRVVPFEEFSMWVDEALLWLNKQLESNKNIINLVKGGED